MINYYFQQLIQFAQQNSLMFIFIVITSFIAIFILTILLLNPKKLAKVNTKHSAHLTVNDSHAINQDIRAIAGDDLCVTQLDMARAYIELGNLVLAKQILESVMHQGDQGQKQTAQELLLSL